MLIIAEVNGLLINDDNDYDDSDDSNDDDGYDGGGDTYDANDHIYGNGDDDDH
jgi:hypothetical protein